MSDEPTTHEVTSCTECPWSRDYARECAHPAVGDAGRWLDRATPPAWCPLRERPVLVRLRLAPTSPR